MNAPPALLSPERLAPARRILPPAFANTAHGLIFP